MTAAAPPAILPVMRPLAVAAVLLASGCAPAARLLINPTETAPAVEGFLVTSGDLPPDGYSPLGLVHAERRGLYLLWLAPLIRADLERAVDQVLVGEARRLGADGVINVRVAYETVPSFPTSLVTLGTVVRFVKADGLAIKRKSPAAR